MYIYNIAVVWANGDVEGFGASSLSEAGAYKRAADKAASKSKLFQIEYKILSSSEHKQLSVDQQDQIQTDWDKSCD